ncbi:MAG: response regulator transcription factor [Gammaproteobacteria bacterium]|nr:response regulator transcription factor [Gammaproteobacteria bacterium]
MIEILVADDQGMMRTLLSGVCNNAQDMTVVGAAKTGEEAIKMAHAMKPDIALVDIKLPGISGLEVTRRLSRQLPEIRIIVLTGLVERGFAIRAVAAGAKGFLTKQAVVHELVRTIRAVYAGGCYVDAGLAQQIALDYVHREDAAVDSLSDREMDVLLLMLRGQTAAEISDRLALAAKTVEHHRRSIRRKLNVATDAQLGIVAARYGLDPMVEGGGGSMGLGDRG